MIAQAESYTSKKKIMSTDSMSKSHSPCQDQSFNLFSMESKIIEKFKFLWFFPVSMEIVISADKKKKIYLRDIRIQRLSTQG